MNEEFINDYVKCIVEKRKYDRFYVVKAENAMEQYELNHIGVDELFTILGTDKKGYKTYVKEVTGK